MTKNIRCEDCPYAVFRRVDKKVTCNFISAGTGDVPPCFAEEKAAGIFKSDAELTPEERS